MGALGSMGGVGGIGSWALESEKKFPVAGFQFPVERLAVSQRPFQVLGSQVTDRLICGDCDICDGLREGLRAMRLRCRLDCDCGHCLLLPLPPRGRRRLEHGSLLPPRTVLSPRYKVLRKGMSDKV